ncbi:MAG: hypothetical protein WCP53_08605 [Verrucomicrobiota bacterium]
MAPSEKAAASSIAKGRFPEFPELDGFRGAGLHPFILQVFRRPIAS